MQQPISVTLAFPVLNPFSPPSHPVISCSQTKKYKRPGLISERHVGGSRLFFFPLFLPSLALPTLHPLLLHLSQAHMQRRAFLLVLRLQHVLVPEPRSASRCGLLRRRLCG